MCRVYERRMNNVDELKQRLIAVWDGTGMQQNVIDSAAGTNKTLNARFILKCALRMARLTYVRCGFRIRPYA